MQCGKSPVCGILYTINRVGISVKILPDHINEGQGTILIFLFLEVEFISKAKDIS